METERESITQWQVSGGRGTDRHAPLGPCRPNQQGCAQTGARPQSAPMSLVETGLLSTWTRPWLVPAMLSLIHLPEGVCSQARWRGCMSSVKHATQKQCFITQPLNIYVVFSFWLGNWTEVRQAWRQKNSILGKMETTQMYQQQINNWTVLILGLCASKTSHTFTILYFCLCEDFHQDNTLTSFLPSYHN